MTKINWVISVVKGGKFDTATTLNLTYDELDVENFDYRNVIGGVDSNDKATGFELIVQSIIISALCQGLLLHLVSLKILQ